MVKRSIIRAEIEARIAEAHEKMVKGLSDHDIVQIAACNAGIAHFPEAGVAFVSHEWGGGHYSHHVDAWWTDRYGPSVIGGLVGFLPDSHLNLDLEAMQLTAAHDPDMYENAFEENMATPAWVAEIAAAWRAEMLCPAIIREEATLVAERWIEHLENQETSAAWP